MCTLAKPLVIQLKYSNTTFFLERSVWSRPTAFNLNPLRAVLLKSRFPDLLYGLKAGNPDLNFRILKPTRDVAGLFLFRAGALMKNKMTNLTTKLQTSSE